MAKRKTVPRFIKLIAIWRDKCHCFYCGKEGIYTDHYGPRVIEKEKKPIYDYDGFRFFKDIAFEFDHKIPLQKGGLTTAENIVLACFECNRIKGAKWPEGE